MSELERLTEAFRLLGANDPEVWAAYQISEGSNQLGRLLFLKQAWTKVLDENDTGWIELEVSEAKHNPTSPFAGIGLALSKMRATGVDEQLLTDVVRGMQASLLFDFCSLLDDPGLLPAELSETAWCLFEIDENGNPVRAIPALHESVLSTDPTGREMKPRP